MVSVTLRAPNPARVAGLCSSISALHEMTRTRPSDELQPLGRDLLIAAQAEAVDAIPPAFARCFNLTQRSHIFRETLSRILPRRSQHGVFNLVRRRVDCDVVAPRKGSREFAGACRQRIVDVFPDGTQKRYAGCRPKRK
jgi:hypothetical protein